MSDACSIKAELLAAPLVEACIVIRGGVYRLGLGGDVDIDVRKELAARIQGVLLPIIMEGAYYGGPAERDAARRLYTCLLSRDIDQVRRVLELHCVKTSALLDPLPLLAHVPILLLRVVATEPGEPRRYPMIPFKVSDM